MNASTSAPVTDTAVRAATERLLAAASTRVPCAPVRDLIGTDDVDAAYAVQRGLTQARLAAGGRQVGRKIGLTSPSVQAQLGVDQPDFGVLFDDMALAEGGEVPAGRLLQPKIEAEIAFVLAADLADGDLGTEQVRAAVAYAVAAFEIVDSRITDWDITFADTVADNASSGMYVLGTQQVRLDDVDPVTAQMEMRLAGDVVSVGEGAACLGDPLAALAWLARTVRDLGSPLRANELVLSGALGPMHPAAPGDRFTASISGIGDVSVSFAKENT